MPIGTYANAALTGVSASIRHKTNRHTTVCAGDAMNNLLEAEKSPLLSSAARPTSSIADSGVVKRNRRAKKITRGEYWGIHACINAAPAIAPITPARPARSNDAPNNSERFSGLVLKRNVNALGIPNVRAFARN